MNIEQEPSGGTRSFIELAKNVVINGLNAINPNTYTCMTADCKRLGGVVVSKSDMAHVHFCPIEGDQCNAWDCNSKGSCQA